MNRPDMQPHPSAEASPVARGSETAGNETEFLWLEVARIRPYDRNPRRTDNPAYARIKASIRAGGMAQPLVVTRRPGENDYTVAAGGNTRLRILQELHARDRRPALSVARPAFTGPGRGKPTSSSPISRRTTCAAS